MAGGTGRIDDTADEVGDLDRAPLRFDGRALEPVNERAPRTQQQRGRGIDAIIPGASGDVPRQLVPSDGSVQVLQFRIALTYGVATKDSPP